MDIGVADAAKRDLDLDFIAAGFFPLEFEGLQPLEGMVGRIAGCLDHVFVSFKSFRC
jgi:hypothetical protein